METFRKKGPSKFVNVGHNVFHGLSLPDICRYWIKLLAWVLSNSQNQWCLLLSTHTHTHIRYIHFIYMYTIFIYIYIYIHTHIYIYIYNFAHSIHERKRAIFLTECHALRSSFSLSVFQAWRLHRNLQPVHFLVVVAWTQVVISPGNVLHSISEEYIYVTFVHVHTNAPGLPGACKLKMPNSVLRKESFGFYYINLRKGQLLNNKFSKISKPTNF